MTKLEPTQSGLEKSTVREEADAQGSQAAPPNLIKRYLFAGLGIVFVAIGAVGVFLPGIPTVGPLLLASFMFTKSIPALEKRLIRNKFFARFLPYLDGSSELPIKAKLFSIALMWCSILFSCTVIYFSSVGGLWLPGLLLLAGLVGTIFILRFGRQS